MREHKETLIEVTFGDQAASIRRSGSSAVVVAGILGKEVDPETGKATVWLDRLVHRIGECTMRTGSTVWSATGAISSVLVEQ